jgi:hypothetical protein
MENMRSTDFLPKMRDLGALAESHLANYLGIFGIGANSVETKASPGSRRIE